ncbi:hypothetical protein MLD38_024964 [Melastoma candidum]|uniref:Uncharacterized protein n=1 Tax=Melastoma candidum TaxID=119954 RepID=A0ACB9NUV7_9MYRT|nr:hypothetical protein MLD38_024964 [Melastoma candidum]
MADESTSTILSALSTLPHPLLSSLLDSVVSDTRHRHSRISSLLSSPPLFSLTLLRLLSLSLPDKSRLSSLLLVSSLHCLTLPFARDGNAHEHCIVELPHCPHFPRMMPGDEDAVLLLFLLCDLQHRRPQALQEASPSDWQRILKDLCYDTMVSLCGVSSLRGSALVPYIETAVRCHQFVSSMPCPAQGEEEEVAASASTVKRLPWVEVGEGGRECTVCCEEMKGGRQACELPCGHMFHWTCIMPWLSKRNTCPSCRHELPTDDISGEIRRLWNVLMRRGQLAHVA